MKTIVRPINEEDIPDVVDIQIAGWQTAYKGIIDEEFLDMMNREERIKERKNDYKKGLFIVAEQDNKIVGFCRYDSVVVSPDGDGFNCELMALYVKPELKYQGIGKAMFDYTKGDLITKGKKDMILWCLKDNEPSRKFYEKMGGTIIGEHTINIGGKSYEEVGFAYLLKN